MLKIRPQKKLSFLLVLRESVLTHSIYIDKTIVFTS